MKNTWFVMSLPIVGMGAMALQRFVLDVANGNEAPRFFDMPSQIEGVEGKGIEFTVSATDTDRDNLIFWADNLPAGATFDPETRVFAWLPDYDPAGTYPDVRFSVTDGISEISASVTLLVEEGHQAPTLTKPADRTVQEGDRVRFYLQAQADPAAKITFSSELLPWGATLHPEKGLLEWTPRFTQAGVYEYNRQRPCRLACGRGGAVDQATASQRGDERAGGCQSRCACHFHHCRCEHEEDRDRLKHKAVVRSMPNTPGQIGQGITVWTASKDVTEEQQEMTRNILGALGEEVFVEDESYLDMATALSGTGPAYVFLFTEALIDAGVHMGFPRPIAEQLVLQTIKGSAAYYEQAARHPATLRNKNFD